MSESERLERLPLRRGKRLFDVTLALLLLIAILPVCAAVALCAWVEQLFHRESRGPLFHREKRVSHGRVFTLYKFRTAKQSVLAEATERPDFMSVKQLEYDPANLTCVGRRLVDYYLDELPQLVNILRGDMSFVGPRPCPVERFRELEAAGIDSNRVIPGGLTGATQARKGHIRRDSYYPVERSYVDAYRNLGGLQLLRHDLALMARTPRVVAEGRGL